MASSSSNTESYSPLDDLSGCNVENASYGLSICAERTAAVKAVSEGYRKFKACFVLTRSPKKIAPCGTCRQFLAEVSISNWTNYFQSSLSIQQEINPKNLTTPTNWIVWTWHDTLPYRHWSKLCQIPTEGIIALGFYTNWTRKWYSTIIWNHIGAVYNKYTHQNEYVNLKSYKFFIEFKIN